MSGDRKPDIRKWLTSANKSAEEQPRDAAAPAPALSGPQSATRASARNSESHPVRRTLFKDVADRTSPRKPPAQPSAQPSAQTSAQPMTLADTRRLGADSPSWRMPKTSRSTPGSPRPTSAGAHGTQDSRHSSPTRPSTPGRNNLSVSPSPTRALFRPDHGGSGSGKRTANMAAFSPHKTRPAAKQAKMSPTPDALKSSPSFHSSPPGLSPSPSGIPAKPVFDREMEIKGSDDEDDDDLSDGSLPDIDTLVPSIPDLGATASQGNVGTYTSRRQKQTAANRKTALSAQSKPRFNIKALLDHQKLDDAINANFKKHEDADAADTKQKGSPGNDNSTASPNTVRKQFIDMAGVHNDTAGKALRAMERTEAASADRNSWYFFKTDQDPTEEQSAGPFPTSAAKGPWTLLAKEGTRSQHIQSGALGLWASRLKLPDEIFTWMLNAMAVEKSLSLRDRYQEMISFNCHEQIRHLVTPECLQRVYRRLGAADDVDDERIRPVQEIGGAYDGRDWSALQTYLEWLGNIASYLGRDALVYAASSLLRMGVDKALVSNLDTRESHQRALVDLVDVVDAASWDDFCNQVCRSLYTGFEKTSLRAAPLSSMADNAAHSRGRLYEMRRRLAIAFFFDDPSLAGRHPDQDTIIPDAIERLKHDESLKIRRKTDYVELGAKMQLLDAAVDDGSFSPGARAAEDAPDREARFNADLDHLASRLRDIWGSINDAGALYLSRTQAKNAIDCTQKRLTYSERTRPPAKQSIFDDMPGPHGHVLGQRGQRQQQENVSQKQKDFMDKFIGNLKKQPRRVEQLKAGTGDDGEGLDGSDDDTFVTADGGN